MTHLVLKNPSPSFKDRRNLSNASGLCYHKENIGLSMTSPPTARSPWTKLVAASGLSIVFNGWGASSDLMSDLLNANQPIIDQLTDRWIVWKRNELQFVALTVSMNVTVLLS